MQAGVDRAKSDLDHAKLDYDRYSELLKQKLIAKQDLRIEEGDLRLRRGDSERVSKAKLVQARAQIAQADATNLCRRNGAFRSAARATGQVFGCAEEVQFVFAARWGGDEPADEDGGNGGSRAFRVRRPAPS